MKCLSLTTKYVASYPIEGDIVFFPVTVYFPPNISLSARLSCLSCLPAYLPVCLFMSLSLSVCEGCLSVYVKVVCLFVSVSLSFFICCLSVCVCHLSLCVCLSIFMSICLSVCMPDCLK
jgi:hypothetical protein